MSIQTYPCLEDERVSSVLEAAIEWHEEPKNAERVENSEYAGWEVGDVGSMGWEVMKLLEAGLVERGLKTNNAKYFRVVNLDEARDALTAAQTPAVPSESDHDPIDPDDLFRDVVGREDATRWIKRTIDRDAQVHHLLVGPPGGGKSAVLDDVAALEGGIRVVMSGNQASAAGVRDVLIEHRPKYLVVEEIEKGTKSDREALMTLCGNGYVTKTKSGQEGVEIELDTIVIAAGNDPDQITPPSLVDRFTAWEFPKYSHQEYVKVCESVLPREHDVTQQLAVQIATKVYKQMDSTSVREAKRIASLVDSKADVDDYIDAVTN